MSDQNLGSPIEMAGHPYNRYRTACMVIITEERKSIIVNGTL